MKVITNNHISVANKYPCSRFSSSTATVGNNSECLNNTLNQLSFMGRSQVVQKLTKEKVLTGHSEFLKELGDAAKGVREFISECKDGSRELLDIDTLFSVFDSKKFKELNITPDKGIFKGFGKGKKIPQALSEDLELLRKPGNIMDNYVPKLSRADAKSKTKVGDVFQIEGSNLVSMKTKNGTVEELKMTAEDFMRLFPPVKRFAGIQSKAIGNCYEETALNALISNPETRENIFKSIDTISDKHKVTVKLPNSIFKDGVSFCPNVISKNIGNEYYTQGCQGLQIIQHALGLEYEKEFVEYQIKKLHQKGKDAQAIWVNQNRGNSVKLANYFNGKFYNLPLGTNLREAGDAWVPWYKLGLHDIGEATLIEEKNYSIAENNTRSKYKHETDDRKFLNTYIGDIHTADLDGFWERLDSPDFFNSHVIELSANKNNTETKFLPDHSYGLRAVINDEGKIEGYMVKNPHEITETPLNFEEVINNFDYLAFARFK